MKSAHIVVIDENIDIQELIKYNLEKDSVHVQTFFTGVRALHAIKMQAPDVVISDAGKTGHEGMELFCQLKQDEALANIPFIMLAWWDSNFDVLKALEMGVEACFEKPVRIRELIRAAKQIVGNCYYKVDINGIKSGRLSFSGLTIDNESYKVFLDNHSLEVNQAEFRLLKLFLCKPGKVYTTNQLQKEISAIPEWSTCTITDVFNRLKVKLGRYRKIFEYIDGVGYRLNDTLRK